MRTIMQDISKEKESLAFILSATKKSPSSTEQLEASYDSKTQSTAFLAKIDLPSSLSVPILHHGQGPLPRAQDSLCHFLAWRFAG